jgi:CRISPR-associated protein Csm5
VGGGEHLKRTEHLESYCVKLRTIGPVFIGSGHKYGKNDYFFDEQKRTISIIREEAMMKWLISSGNVDAYEREFLGPGRKNIWQFLKRSGISAQEWKELIRYTIDVGGVLKEGISLKEIDAFIRNSAGEAYIPGSSLKGALRTAILFDKIKTNGRRSEDKIDRELEEKYLQGMMRGVAISDSAPIPDSSLTLVQKVDLRQDNQKREPNLVRECLRPGCEIFFTLTLDHAIFRERLSAQDILKAIADFYDYYRSEFSARFPEEDPDAPAKGRCLFLGGGSGFFNKTLVYPYFGYDQALPKVAGQMSRSFRSHHHEQDEQTFGISPHCMKYGRAGGKLHEFGLCEVSFI